jgi:hypothetical protein
MTSLQVVATTENWRSDTSHPSPPLCIGMLPDERAMESTLSTLSEIAANLLKRERVTRVSAEEVAAQDSAGWDALMTDARHGDIHQWQASLSQHIADNHGQRRVTVLRVIEGGLS